MRELVEVSWQQDDQPEDGNTVYVKEKYWLLHWGLKYEIIDTGEGNMIAINHTVAICENVKTGNVECFPPESLRILGTEIKK